MGVWNTIINQLISDDSLCAETRIKKLINSFVPTPQHTFYSFVRLSLFYFFSFLFVVQGDIVVAIFSLRFNILYAWFQHRSSHYSIYGLLKKFGILWWKICRRMFVVRHCMSRSNQQQHIVVEWINVSRFNAIFVKFFFLVHWINFVNTTSMLLETHMDIDINFN